jgi:hypothetical protein
MSTAAVGGERFAGGHSSGTPALHSPARKVASYKALVFGDPQHPPALKRAMLE